MARHILPGDPPVALTLRRSRRARRISLRVSQLDGRVTLTLPQRVPESEAMAFAASRERWIRKHLLARPADVVVGPGTDLPVEGLPHRVVLADTGSRVRVARRRIEVPGHPAGPRLRAWLRALARDRLAAACDAYAAALGRPYARMTLRDTRSRWGSCSAQGGLNFSWRLILAPPDVLRYVAAHEVAHLAEMNHSPAFWSTVERLYGPCDRQRRWLRENGAGLHRFRFDLPTTDGG